MPLPILAFDSGSPLASVALAVEGEIVASRAEWVARSSTRLLQLIREVLDQAQMSPRDLGGLLAVAGPGSFTGLRIGLATAYGLYQSLASRGLRVAAIPTLDLLAAQALFAGANPQRPLVAAVDALRGEWTVQAFERGPDGLPTPLGVATLVAAVEFGVFAPATFVGFGLSRLADTSPLAAGLDIHEPGPLAPVALQVAALREPTWDARALTRPLYARAAAATLPNPRQRTIGSATVTDATPR